MARTISSLMGFVRKIREVNPLDDEVLLYRGHPNREFKLLPSVLRDPALEDAEDGLLRELVATHPTEFANDRTTLEQLARAQHYSLPTRLLDATWNPLVALYFASHQLSGTTGEVVVFRIKKDQVKFYDSDTVSCISNLAYLKSSDKKAIDLSLPSATFNNEKYIRQLVGFVSLEKPNFAASIDPVDLKRVLCVKPKRNSQRILVQSGAFLLFGMAKSLDSVKADGIEVERIKVNGNHKEDILRELDVVAINESTLFPEIDKAAVYIRNRI